MTIEMNTMLSIPKMISRNVRVRRLTMFSVEKKSIYEHTFQLFREKHMPTNHIIDGQAAQATQNECWGVRYSLGAKNERVVWRMRRALAERAFYRRGIIA